MQRTITTTTNTQLTKSQRRRARLVRSLRNQPNTTQNTVTLVQRPAKKRSKKMRKGQNMMLTSNITPPWSECLKDPEIAGGKIPDVCGVPTGTWQCTSDGTLVAPASGAAGLFFNPLAGVISSNITDFTTAGGWGGTSSVGGYTSLTSVYESTRVVSAKIDLEFVGSSGTDAGQVAAALCRIPVNQVASAATLNASIYVPQTFNSLLTQSYSECYPVRNGLRILWRPIDNEDITFFNTGQTLTTIAAGMMDCPSLVCGVSSMVTGQSVRFRIIVNYEGIPKSDTSGAISMTPSPANFNEIQKAYNWGQRLFDKVIPLFQASTPAINAASQLGFAWYANKARYNRITGATGRRIGPIIEEVE
jgi:hypothetical protein